VRKGRTEKVLIQRIEDGRIQRVQDEVVVEEPLEIRLDGQLVGTTMRTPGHDYELAVGFCVGENLLKEAAISGVRYCGEGAAAEFEFNVVTVETDGRTPIPVPRLGNVSSSCGLCGSVALSELASQMAPILEPAEFEIDQINAVVANVEAEQELFARTGGLHAAAVFDSEGCISVLREDIGRHNAVDKVIGNRRLEDKRSAEDLGLFVSGRASFEMVQKAWAGGFGTVVAVSAPSALAIQVAAAANITLYGFARDGSINLYAGHND